MEYKHNEDRYLTEIKEYIDETYSLHYAHPTIGTLEFINDLSLGDGFIRGNIIKYVSRNKVGQQRSDILKIIHYGILLLDSHDNKKN